MKLAILVPFYKTLPSKTCQCLLELARMLPVYKYDSTFLTVDNTYIHGAREILYNQFESLLGDKNCDWILHIDSDQTFKFKDVLKLISDAEENGFDILSGVYFGRTVDDISPVLMNIIDEETRFKIAEARKCAPEEVLGEYYKLSSLPPNKFFEVDVMGFGFFICRPKVYEDIKKKFGTPIFPIQVNSKGTDIRGEDAIWCERAKACGYKIMIDGDVLIGHMGGEITYRDFKAWQVERYLASQKENEAFYKEEK